MTLLNTDTTFTHYFYDTDFPAHRDDLVVIARRGGADRTTVEQLRLLPDRSFDGPYAISQVITKP
jgi:hypothetical protein